MNLNDHEVGYYIGLITHAKMLQELIEHCQERGLNPYQIVDIVLAGNTKVYQEAGQLLIKDGYELKNYEVKDET